MFDLAKFLLRFIYYKSRLLGVLSFEIDLRTGRARCTRFALVQATIVHLVLGVFIVQFLQSGLWSLMWQNSSQLSHYFNLIILIVRLLYMYTAILTQTWNRHRLASLINGFQRLARKRPQIVRLWRCRVICKCLSIFLTEFLLLFMICCLVWMKFSVTWCFAVIYLPYAFLELVTFQFYFALLSAHSHYKLLNQELRQLLKEISTLETLVNRRAALMIRCCSLADRLEAIAEEQCQLQALVDDLTGVFGLQSLCVAGNYYMCMVAVVFHTYEVVRQIDDSVWNNLQFAFFLCKVTSHILELYVTSNMSYAVLDEHAKMVNILSGCSTLALQLDERLEAVVS